MTNFPLVDSFLSGLSKRYSTTKAGVLPSDGLFRFFLCPAVTTEDLQDVAMALFAFFGCLRACELVVISLKDIEYVTEGILVRSTRFKTGGKDTRFILANRLDGSTLSPAVLAKSYLEKVTPWLVSSKQDRIWPRPSGDGFCAQFRGVNHATRVAKKIAKFLGLDASQYTGHSFRRTSATTAADSGISLLNLKRLGGWKSDSVAESYIDNSRAAVEDAARLLVPRKASTEINANNQDDESSKCDDQTSSFIYKGHHGRGG